MLNAICLSPKTAVTVRSPVCPTASSAAFCRPTKGQAHHWLLSLNWRLFHLFISSFLPSFSCSPLFWLIIPPSQKKPPPACRRRFLAVYSQSLSLPIPKGCRETALEATKATIKTEVVHSIVSLTSLQRVSTMHIFSYKKHEIILLLVACMQLSVCSHDSYQTYEYLLPCFSHFQHKINEPSGKIQLQSRTWPVVEWDL